MLRKHDSETRCYLKTLKTPPRVKKTGPSEELHPKYKSLIREPLASKKKPFESF